jgi:hypothetical protein
MNVSLWCDFCVSQKLITTPSHRTLRWEEYKRQRKEALAVSSQNLTLMLGLTRGPCRSSSPENLTHSGSLISEILIDGDAHDASQAIFDSCFSASLLGMFAPH